MGNRLASGAWSPKRRKDKRKSTAKGDAGAATGGGEAETASPVTQRGSVVAGEGDITDTNAVEDATASPRPTSPWPRVAATVHAVDALEETVREASERQRQREEQHALTRSDPALFFSVHGAYGDSDRGTDDVALQYAHALVVAANSADAGATEAAATLLRPIATRPVAAPLAADARVHLAQCLVLMDPTLLGSTSASQVETLLVECVRGDIDEELVRQATELLASVRLARGEIHGARELFDREQPEAMELGFQRACCRHLMGSDSDTSGSWCEQDAPTAPLCYAALLQADTAALRVGPQ